MEINKHDKGVTFINEEGTTVNLAWHEFWEICRYGRMIDTILEVEEYIEGCEEIAGVSAEKILDNQELIQRIADKVIDYRIKDESGDDIWHMVNEIIKNGGNI